MQPFSLYIHVPFCQRKCHYCDFNTYAGLEQLIPPYLEALKQEVGQWSPLLSGWEVRTVFLGGGTPSLLTGPQLRELLDLCRERFAVAQGAEVTLEANPGTVDGERLRCYREAGVNRISFGAQSFHSDELLWLGRIHSEGEIAEAVQLARDVGYTRINLDLIYGLPEQPQKRWEESLRAAMELAPDHLSLYALTVEEGTPLAQWVAVGKASEPDPDVAADHYLAAERMLGGAGFRHYEISNWALPGQECLHNLTYWKNQPYLGLGAGAHSYFGGYRFHNVLLPQEYIRRVRDGGDQPHRALSAPRQREDVSKSGAAAPFGSIEERPQGAPLAAAIGRASPVAAIQEFATETDLGDTLVLGLRLAEGVGFAEVEERYGIDVPRRFGPALRESCELGLLEIEDRRMRLTPRGRLLANEVFLRFWMLIEGN